MDIQLNGERRVLMEPLTLWQLLEGEGIPPEQIGVAIAVNRQVIPRQAWKDFRLQGGEVIELVYARQGG